MIGAARGLRAHRQGGVRPRAIRCSKFDDYKDVLARIVEARHILAEDADREMRELAQAEIDELTRAAEPKLEEELRAPSHPARSQRRQERLPRDPRRRGRRRGGLFAADLFRMYSKYAERQRWKVEVIDSHPTGIGGFKEVIALVQGRGAWSRLKFERGVHRVQRVPATESSGRIHTSTVTVAVLPEAEDVDVKVDDKDIQIDVYRSSGPGGQGVNTTDSAVRLTHLPDRARRHLPGRALADQEPREGAAGAQGPPARAGAGASRPPPSPPTGGARSARASAASASAPTTSRRDASPITASTSRCTGCPRCSRATSTS